ncbi:hypothetical protein PCAR4_830046 [Paraburkholderia caribensis]|nr:hypothetical protein PCAR4_830046 [Paraburkholderia caribensis]
MSTSTGETDHLVKDDRKCFSFDCAAEEYQDGMGGIGRANPRRQMPPRCVGAAQLAALKDEIS